MHFLRIMIMKTQEASSLDSLENRGTQSMRLLFSFAFAGSSKLKMVEIVP